MYAFKVLQNPIYFFFFGGGGGGSNFKEFSIISSFFLNSVKVSGVFYSELRINLKM